MTVDERLIAALRPLGYDVANAVSFSHSDRYYAFNYFVMPTDYADDEPEHERYLVQVHLFAPLAENITQRKRDTRKALHAAGFTWASIEDASDEDGRHIVFECEIAEGVDDGDDDD